MHYLPSLLRNLSRHLPRPARGASLLDYGLVAVLIVIVSIPIITAIGGSVGGNFSTVTSGLNGGGTGGGGGGGGEPTPEPTPTPAPNPYLLTGTFDVDNTDLSDNAWPGTWNSAYGDAGAGDGGVETVSVVAGTLGPPIAIDGGDVYNIQLRGCSASGGGTYFAVRWYDAANAQISNVNQSSWANCPSWQMRDVILAAPANATSLRFNFVYANRYDDVRIHNTSDETPSTFVYQFEGTFDTDNTTADGKIWPGSWGAAHGEEGAGDGGMDAYALYGPSYPIVAGHVYHFRAYGCTNSGGSSQPRIRWFNASGAQVGSNNTRDWPACPSYGLFQYWFAAPAGAVSMRIWFDYHNRYDDVIWEDTSDANQPSYGDDVLVASFDADRRDDVYEYLWSNATWSATGGPTGDGSITTIYHGSSPIYPVGAGRSVTYTVKACSDSGGGTSFTLKWMNNAGEVSNLRRSGSLTNCPAWQTFTGTAVVPAGVNGVRLNAGWAPRIGDISITYND